ncbi:hypothetical protein TSUD_40740 [Trifolium subterraneum]|nr:hypothetical protein TSUD_40740 [Trifolium subterraneum]
MRETMVVEGWDGRHLLLSNATVVVESDSRETFRSGNPYPTPVDTPKHSTISTMHYT